MKKAMFTAIAGSMFAGFGGSAAEAGFEKATVEPARVLVAYYSWGGNTRYAAERIHRETGGTLFEIKPKTPYITTDYDALVEQAKKECAEKFTPELAEKPENLDAYDVIFIGTPNWWHTMAPPVRSFLGACDFSGKTVVLFVTHGGGGMANCERDFRELASQAKILAGKAFSGRSIKQADAELARFVHDRISLKQ